jgi:hypothetical protein
MAHSLVRERLDLLQQLVNGAVRFEVERNLKTGESSQRFVKELPPEEAFESFAARLRPFTMRDEPVYWENVLDAIEKLVSEETRNEIIDVDSLRAQWAGATQGRRKAQAYYVMAENGQLTDFQLAELWLNSDALHTHIIQSAVGKDLSLNERYRAAAEVYSRIGVCVNTAYFVVHHLYHENLIDLDEAVFTEPVIADTRIELPMVAYSAPVGSIPMPTNLAEVDLSAWKPIDEDIELLASEEGA